MKAAAILCFAFASAAAFASDIAAAPSSDVLIIGAAVTDLIDQHVELIQIFGDSNGSEVAPSMSILRTAGGGVLCRLNMSGFDNVAASVGQRGGGLTAERVARLRTLTIIHEVGHCELAASDRRLAVTGQSNEHTLTKRYFDSFTRQSKKLGDLQNKLAAGVQELVSERHADAKALLTIAMLSFKDAVSPARRQTALDTFNLYAHDLRELREVDKALIESVTPRAFNDHDTISVIDLVKSAVNVGASDEQALTNLQRGYLQTEKLTFAAILIALGSVRSEIAQITNMFIRASTVTGTDAHADVWPVDANQDSDVRRLLRDADEAFNRFGAGTAGASH